MSDQEPINPSPDVVPPTTPRKPKRKSKAIILPEEQWLVVKQIAEQLNEPNRRQIVTLVHHTSLEFALEVLQETLAVEAQGGLMLPDNSRRRTSGGVFFYLARKRLPPEIRYKVFFYTDEKKPKRKQRPAATPSPEFPPFVWEERREIIATLLDAPGNATTAKVTLIGRPEFYELFANLALITLTAPPRLTALPRGVPKPENGLEATYSVLIALKHWTKVDAALMADESDFLIIEGLYAHDEASGGMAVYATSVTTRNLQMQKRQK